MVLRTLLACLALGGLVAAGAAIDARAAGSPAPGSEKSAKERPAEYDEGVELVEKGDFGKARRAFEQANRKSPRDADILNMLAYSQRKSGRLDRAIETYQQALKLRPRFPQAREYLAEAYLQAALRELDTLESYGSEADAERAQVIQTLQAAAADLPPPPEVKAPKSEW
jgi:tetratricopeptide (TPR) repeat protein